MSNNSDQPAYPVTANIDGRTGLTKKERLAMEIYVMDLRNTAYEEVGLQVRADYSLRAADIFFEQLEKNSKV